MKQASEAEILHRMAAYCSTAERCKKDVRKKIEQAGLSAEAAERIIAHLEKEKYIDEKRFAGSFVNDKLRFNKWGRVKIAYELGKKLIPTSIRNEALDRIDEDTYRSILFSLLKDKKKSTKAKDERELFAKLLRFAGGRGFESREATACLRQLLNGTDYDEDFE